MIDEQWYSKVLYWFNSTYNLIVAILDLNDIPWTVGYDDDSLYYYNRQICFPWCTGDIIIRTPSEEDVISKPTIRMPSYPVIESHGFPWDHDGVTYFSNPNDLLMRISAHADFMKIINEEVSYENQ